MLGWLAAAAAPILIHLWMRQTRRETPWAAIRFLQAALERQARRLRLQHWILLAVRTLLLVCLALAAAKPFLDQSGVLSGLAGGVHQVLVIDGSLSMQTKANDESRFARAKREARRIVSQARSGDRFSVVTLASSPAIVANTSNDTAAVTRSIDALTPTAGEASVDATLAVVGRVIGLSEEDSPRTSSAGPVRVTVLTDLDEATWGDVTVDSAAGLSLSEIARLGPVTAIDVGKREVVGNATVTRLTFDRKLVTTGREVAISADTAARRGSQPSDTTAALLVDGVAVAQQEVTLNAAGGTTIDFRHRFDEPGTRVVAVQLGDDALTADNTHSRVLRVYDRVRVLCVGGAPGATRYVVDALNPTGDRESPIAAQRIADADFRTVDLASFACVFCCNVSEFTPAEAERLAEFVGAGGGLVFFLGDRVNAAAYNRVLGPGAEGPLSSQRSRGRVRLVSIGGANADASTSPLLPLVLGEPVSDASYQIDPLGYDHPIVVPFRGRERAGLLTVPVMRRCPIRLADRSTHAEVALAIGGSPLLVTAGYGRGRVAVVGTAASVDPIDPATGGPWTAWPAWPSFLPIVRGLMEYTAGATTDEPTLVVGDVLSGRLADASPPSIRRPDGQVDPTIERTDGGWTYDTTDTPGVYQVENALGDDPAGYAVNTSDAESSLRPVDRNALPATLSVVVGGPASAASTAAANAPLHRLLLYAAVVLALLDTALAAWFGRGHA